jgi:hypothetical protein
MNPSYEERLYVEPPVALKHSGIGISSFILALAAGIGTFVVVVVAGAMAAAAGPQGINEQSPQAVVVGLLLIGGVLASLLALVLGIVGLCEKNRKKIFALLGTLLSGLTLLCVVGLFILGTMVG